MTCQTRPGLLIILIIFSAFTYTRSIGKETQRKRPNILFEEILIAPNAFKNSLFAQKITEAIKLEERLTR